MTERKFKLFFSKLDQQVKIDNEDTRMKFN